MRTVSDAAWAEFLELFAPLLLQAASFVERDRDAAADAFVLVCERLRDNQAGRLAQYVIRERRRLSDGLPATR